MLSSIVQNSRPCDNRGKVLKFQLDEVKASNQYQPNEVDSHTLNASTEVNSYDSIVCPN